jgi:hypothetical protein
MADPIVFGIFDDAGAPDATAVPSFVSGSIYDHATLAARAAPAFFNRGDGQHGFEPTAADEAVGCVALLDAGAGKYFATGSRFAAVTIPEAAPFEAFALTDAADAPYAGVTLPTFQSYEGRSGPLVPQPAFGRPIALSGLFCFTPSASDIAAGVSYRVDAPANAYPDRLFGSATAPTVGPYTPPSSGTYPADAVAQMLAGVIALPNPPGGADVTLTYGTGGNLLLGPVRSFKEAGIEQLAVFVIQSGGQQPLPYMGQDEGWHVSRVQVTVRSELHSFAAGEALARALHARANRNTPPGYTYCLAAESDPSYLGTDDDGSHRFVFNLNVGHRR